MPHSDFTRLICQAIYSAQQGNVQYEEVYASPDPANGRHEFLFFIKPEITRPDDDEIKTELILEMLMNKLDQFKFSVKSIRILGASYLDQYNIIAQHYGVINALSRDPLKHFSTETFEKFERSFGIPATKAHVLGSLQFIQHFDDFTPQSLHTLWQSSDTVKLGGGTYCAKLKMKNETVFLINGFHPLQLIHFTEKGRSIITFRLSSDVDWSVARNKFIGKTNPADAEPGSLRNEILVNSDKYGLQDISASRNGFHLSAGPVEGLVELIRYCSDYTSKEIMNAADFSFGKLLHAHFVQDEITKICNNATLLFSGKKITVFDLTEEKNADEALSLLKNSQLL